MKGRDSRSSLLSSPLLLLRQTSAQAGRLTMAKPHLVPITLDQAFILSQTLNLGEGGSCLGKASPSGCPKTGSKSAISWNVPEAQLAVGVGRAVWAFFDNKWCDGAPSADYGFTMEIIYLFF